MAKITCVENHGHSKTNRKMPHSATSQQVGNGTTGLPQRSAIKYFSVDGVTIPY